MATPNQVRAMIVTRKKLMQMVIPQTAQMKDLMNKLRPETRGGMIVNPGTNKVAWPLTQSNFGPSLTALLQTNVATNQIRGLCLASEASLLDNNQTLASWKAQDQNEMIKQFQSGNPQLPLSVKFQGNTVGTHNIQLNVQRCCVTESALNATPLVCNKNYTQSIS